MKLLILNYTTNTLYLDGSTPRQSKYSLKQFIVVNARESIIIPSCYVLARQGCITPQNRRIRLTVRLSRYRTGRCHINSGKVFKNGIFLLRMSDYRISANFYSETPKLSRNTCINPKLKIDQHFFFCRSWSQIQILDWCVERHCDKKSRWWGAPLSVEEERRFGRGGNSGHLVLSGPTCVLASIHCGIQGKNKTQKKTEKMSVSGEINDFFREGRD